MSETEKYSDDYLLGYERGQKDAEHDSHLNTRCLICNKLGIAVMCADCMVAYAHERPTRS